MSQLPALLEIDTGLEAEADVTATQIATKLDLGLKPALPTVVDAEGNAPIAGLPAQAANAFAQTNALAARIMNELETNKAIGNREAKAYAKAIVTGAEAEKIKALQADNADLKAENQIDEIFEALGGHAASVDRAKDAFAFEVQLEALHEKRADILDDEHTGIGIIDDVINSFRVYNTEEKIELTAQAAAQNQQDIVNATANTEAASKASNLVKQTANEGTIAANQQLIAADAQAKLYEAHLVQTRSNADSLQSMLSASMQKQNNVIRAFELAGSEEGRELARQRFQLALRAEERQAAMHRVSLRRAEIGEQRERLAGDIEGRTATAREQSILTSLDQQETALDRSILDLDEALATSEDRVAMAGIRRGQAETTLDIANLAFDKAMEEETDPLAIEAKAAQRELAVLNLARAKAELTEFEDQTGLRLASREGAVEAQTLQNKIAALTLDSQEALAAGNKREALAKLAEAESLRVDKATVDAIDVANVQSYQSFMFGAHNREEKETIIARLDSNDPLYIKMRQLGATAGATGEFRLGTTAAEANDMLTLMDEFSGVGISNDIPGVAALREIRNILQKKDADNPKARAAMDEVSLAIRFNETALDYWSGYQAEIVHGDVTNPFRAPTVPQMVELSKGSGTEPKGLATQPLYSKVLIPDNQVDTNIDDIIVKGMVALDAGNLSMDELVEGIVATGNFMMINTNLNHHGLAAVGLPNTTSVNMRVARPRGLLSNVFSNANKVIKIAALSIVSGQFESIKPIQLLPRLQQTSDFITLNIADQVAVRQYLISVRSSTNLAREVPDTVLPSTGGE